jgi:hypothetical protein
MPPLQGQIPGMTRRPTVLEFILAVGGSCAAWIAMGAALVIGGCAPSDQSSLPPAPAVPIATPLSTVEPSLKDQRVDDLLDFETPSDSLFVHQRVAGGWAESGDITSQHPHSGLHCLMLLAGPVSINVKLASLMEGRPFPGNWTLVGAYFYCDHETEATAACPMAGQTQSRTVYIAAAQWTPVFLDLPAETRVPATAPANGLMPDKLRPDNLIPDRGDLSFQFSDSGGAPIYCDDVLLADNLRVYYAPTAGSYSHWVIERRGLNVWISAPSLFSTTVQTPQAAPSGWQVIEAGALRARFQSRGPARFLTIYEDGRSYEDGNYRPLAAALRRDGSYAQSHETPGTVTLPEDQGTVDRSSPGDTTNSGYNRRTGSYRIIAKGSTLEMTLAPRAVPIVAPVIEISHLPPGSALVSAAGQPVQRVDRLLDGTLLIDLPLRIEKPTLIEVRVQ